MKEDVEFEFGNNLYSVRVTGYIPGVRATRDEPGDGPEVDVFPDVTIVRGADGSKEIVSWDHFVADYAYIHGMLLHQADAKIMDEVLKTITERVSDALEEHYDDRDPYEAFDYGGDA